MESRIKVIPAEEAMQVARWPLLPAGTTRIDGIRVYDCGQGDSIAIIGRRNKRSEQVLLQVDYGGYQDNPFAPEYIQACEQWPIQEDSAVLLTHWDQDHYWTASRGSLATSANDVGQRRWLVPRQKVSPRVAVWSTELRSARCFPEKDVSSAIRFRTSSGDEVWLEKIKAMPTKPGCTENRNHSGLAVSLVRRTVNGRQPDLIILPGDAPLHLIGHLAELRPKCRLVGIVAFHHGAGREWDKKTIELLQCGEISQRPAVVFSCSSSNSYGHPNRAYYKKAMTISRNDHRSSPVFLSTSKCRRSKRPFVEVRFGLQAP